ncbi:unnamed protein product [Cylindrotheca closterium]|uniref:Uncharacterized protein n=1 Tax=Cylindrotheca closterium TaxID=2856 RepID=A0AAD2PUS3_9STRA|nr:unnamed protein product [Cylindrotheca closterium]
MSNTKRVSINPTVKVHEILSIHDYTPSEITATWYDEDEMDRITQKCLKILQKLESTSTTKYCVRGLETHTTLGSIGKRKNRAAAYRAVLREQERPWKENEETSSQEAIANAYRCTTSSSQMWAQVVGTRDQQEVEAYLYDDDEEEEDQEMRKAAPSTVCSLCQESRIVMQSARTASSFSARAA